MIFWKIQNLILENFPRRSGDGWKRQKSHELIHIPRDVSKYGLPWNFDAGWEEKCLKLFAKKTAKNVSKVYCKEFDNGIAERVHERLSMNRAVKTMDGYKYNGYQCSSSSRQWQKELKTFIVETQFNGK